MRFLLIILLLFFYLYSCEQPSKKQNAKPLATNSQFKVDSLSQYSYFLIHVLNNKPIGNSTGFFIRSDTNLFLVTTYHTCSCVDVMNKQLFAPEWDLLMLRFFDENGAAKYIRVELEYIKKNRRIEYFFDIDDVCIINANNLKNLNIHSIDQVADLQQHVEQNPDRTLFYGFPVPEKKDTVVTVDGALPVIIDGTMKFSITQPIVLNGLNRILSNSYIIQPHARMGYSGSPVFFSYDDKGDGYSKIAFGGMVYGHHENDNVTYVLKASLILDSINLLTKQRPANR